MADSLPYTSGVAKWPPMEPMLLTVSVPPLTSSDGSFPAAARACNAYARRTANPIGECIMQAARLKVTADLCGEQHFNLPGLRVRGTRGTTINACKQQMHALRQRTAHLQPRELGRDVWDGPPLYTLDVGHDKAGRRVHRDA